MESFLLWKYSVPVAVLAVGCWWREPLTRIAKHWWRLVIAISRVGEGERLQSQPSDSDHDKAASSPTVGDTPNEEEKQPLLRRPPLSPKKGTKQVIAKFEQQVAKNTAISQKNDGYQTLTKKKKIVHAKVQEALSTFECGDAKKKEDTELGGNTKARQVGRCPACRKTLDDAEDAITYQQLTLHTKCFVCRECGVLLSTNTSTNTNNHLPVHLSTSNGKVKFTCKACQESDKLSDSFASVAGEPIVVEQDEYGNVEKVMGEIGDDLEQAVYFMTPRCATCGGDLQATYRTEGMQVVGRTVFHQHCYDTGRPAAHLAKPAVKLPASFCAKYLPQQIVLKLCCEGKTMTTLYFSWHDRETQAVQLRQENADTVVVPFSLDEHAPANPNYSKWEPGSRYKRPPIILPVPNELSIVTMELVPGVTVPPRKPIMPEPIAIVPDEKQDAMLLYSRLSYLFFGLEYFLDLHVPVVSNNNNNNNNKHLHLVGAKLFVTIRDWQ